MKNRNSILPSIWCIGITLVLATTYSESAFQSSSPEALRESDHNENKLSGRIAFVAITSGNWDLWTMNADGTDLVQLTDTPIDERYPTWSPDGKKLVYSTSDGKLWSINRDGTDPKTFSLRFGSNDQKVRNNSQPSWSPDGKRIAFTCFIVRMDDSNIWVMNAEGGELVELVSQKEIQVNPTWSPDGKEIIYSSTIYGPSVKIIQDLWITRSDGQNTRRVLVNDAANIQADWSPDGKKIAFTSDKTGNTEIWVMDTNGQNAKQITHNDAYDADPSWSPDNEYIAFVSNRTGGMQIWVMSADGGNLRQLTDVMGSCKDPAWERLKEE